MRFRIIHFDKSLLCGLLWLLMFAAPSFAQTQDDLFNGDILHEVRIYVNPEDLVTLKQNIDICPNQDLEALEGERVPNVPRIECWFAVDFHWKFNGRDITTAQGGIRSRGKGSRSPIKPSFKIEFDRYESNNHFLGLKALILRANTQDASSMHERVAMEFFRKLGIAAPRDVHTRLYINDQYAGLYSLGDEVDEVFLLRNFGEKDGYLYSYEWVEPYAFGYLGSDVSKYSPLPFQPQNHLIDVDPSPIEAMVRTINESPAAQFSAAVSQYIDLNSLFRELAVENFLADQDSVIGDYLLNNFFLYRFRNSVRSIFIPWDKSNAFWVTDWNIFHNFQSNILTNRALSAAPELISLYRDTLRQAADLAGGVGGWLEQEIRKEYQQIQQAAYEDRLKLCDQGATGYLHPCSNEEFDAEVAYLIRFAQQRAAFVRAQLAQ